MRGVVIFHQATPHEASMLLSICITDVGHCRTRWHSLQQRMMNECRLYLAWLMRMAHA